MQWDRLDRISELVSGFDHEGAELEYRQLDDLVTGELRWLETVDADPPGCFTDEVRGWGDALTQFDRTLPAFKAAVRSDDAPAAIRAIVPAAKALEGVVRAWGAIQRAGPVCP